MKQILSFVGSDPGMVSAVLATAGFESWAARAGEGWGLGYENESRVLLSKQPASSSAVDVGRLLGDLRTRAFVAQVGAPEATSPEHTQPYRWRHMLAATRFGLELSGERREEILAQMPDFLLRNISGTTDAELLFHRFLVHLNVESGLLERPNLSVDAAISALGSWARELTRWGMEDGLEKVALSIVLNSGRRLLALNFGGRVSYRCMAEIEGLDSADRAAIVCVGADPPRPGFCSLETHHICVLGPGSVQELVKLER